MRAGSCPARRAEAMPSMRLRWKNRSCPPYSPPKSSGMPANSAVSISTRASRRRASPRSSSSTVTAAPASAAYAARSRENTPAPLACTVTRAMDAPSGRSQASATCSAESVRVKCSCMAPLPSGSVCSAFSMKDCRPALTTRTRTGSGE